MYMRWAEVRRYKTEFWVFWATAGGTKELIFKISGEGVYGKMKYESGVHRVQEFLQQKLRQNSYFTATVAVLPEIEEIDFKIEEKI